MMSTAESNLNLRSLRVKNIEENVTTNDLHDLFGLGTTPLLKEASLVTMVQGEDGNKYAKVQVPDPVHLEIMKIHGHEFHGRKLVIEEINNTTETTPSDQPSDEEPDEEILFMEIDTRLPEWNMKNNHVTVTEVIDALQVDHSDDPTKSVKKMFGPLLGLYRIESMDFPRYIDKAIVIRGKELKITPRKRTRRPRHLLFKPERREREGTLVTIYDAYQLDYRGIANELFNDYFNSIDGVEVIKSTQPQRVKGRPVLNGNRFLVVKNEKNDGSKLDLGTSVEVQGFRFKIVYDGMEKYCFLCARKHGRDCPTKVRFEFLKQMRKDKTQKRKIYADSTLRQTNQLSLTTDIACMSGGGIGQICNAVPYDEKHDEIVIQAGNNEIANTDSLHEFVFTVEKNKENLRKLAVEENVTLVLPCTPTTGAEEIAKAKFLEESMKDIKEIKTITLENIEYEGRHPTQKGTLKIVEQIHVALNEEVILDGAKDDVTTPLKYSKVQPIYKVGCRGCENLEFTPDLCVSCKEVAQAVDIQQLQDMICKLTDELFPAYESNEIEEYDVTMKETFKRARTSNGSDDENKAKNAKADGGI